MSQRLIVLEKYDWAENKGERELKMERLLEEYKQFKDLKIVCSCYEG